MEEEPKVALESEKKVVLAETTQDSNLVCDNNEDNSSIKVPEPSESKFSNSPIPASLTNSSIEQKLISNLDASVHLDKSNSKDVPKSPDAYHLVNSLPSPTEEEKDLNAEFESEAELVNLTKRNLVNETTIPRKDVLMESGLQYN